MNVGFQPVDFNSIARSCCLVVVLAFEEVKEDELNKKNCVR